VKTHELSQAISKTRDKISIDSKKQKKAKILFKEQVSLDQKFKKTANEFYRTEKTTKKF